MKNKKCVYFAHPINTYGTILEVSCLDMIKNHFQGFDVINPSDEYIISEFTLYRNEHPIDYMQYFARLVIDYCDTIVYLPFKDGMIGAGIWYEIHSLPEDNIFEIDFTNKSIVAVDRVHVNSKHLSVEETRERIKKVY